MTNEEYVGKQMKQYYTGYQDVYRLATVEHLKRNNNALMILYVALGIQKRLLEKIPNDTKKGGTREQQLRMVNVSSSGT